MAPSPAAGRAPKLGAPSTPTKPGKSPASSATPKLSGAAAPVTSGAKNTPASGRRAPKLGQSTTDSPKLPPRPKAAESAAQDVKGKATSQEPSEVASDVGGKIGMKDNDPEEAVKETPGKVTQAAETEGSSATGDLSEAAPDPVEEDEEEEDTIGGAAGEAEEDAPEIEDVEEEAGEAAEDTQEQAAGLTGRAKGLAGKAGKAAGSLKDTAGKAAQGVSEGDPAQAGGAVKETAQGAADDMTSEVEGVPEDVETNGVTHEAGEAVNGVEDTAGDAVDGVEEALPEVDLGVLKGLVVSEGGEILDSEGNPLGRVEEGDPEDLIGQQIGDNGEILDEDGDVIGRCGVLPERAKELAEQAQAEAEEQVEGVQTVVPDIGDLEGLEVGEDGNILGRDGKVMGRITEGDPSYFVGQALNAQGEVLDEDGDVIGRAEAVPQEIEGKVDEVTKEISPDLSILAGKKINKKGNILDEEGEPIGKLTDDSDIKACAGKIPNENGEILDKSGNVIGKVEVVPGEAAEEAMKALHPELLEEVPNGVEEAVEGAEEAAGDKGEDLVDGVEGVAEEAAPELPEIPGMDILEGLKVNKKGEVLNEDGDPIARLAEGDLDAVKGKKINERGEVLDADGDVIGRVELIPEAFGVTQEQLEQAKEAAEAAAPEAPEIPGLDVLEGYKVNKKGEVINEDGETIGRLAEGDIADTAGKKINEKGEVIDKDGNVLGKVELIPEAFGLTQSVIDQAQEAEEEATSRLPDMSILEGLKVNKKGEVVNEDGDVIARLAEGELADLVGKKLNEKGEVVGPEGNIIGKVELIPQEVEEELGEDLPELPPLSILEGLKCNKFGKIVDPSGKPIGELIEGDPKKLAKSGVTCDAEGQFWDAHGRVIGRAQTLPEEEEEEEAPFSGLEGLIVVEGGWVEDENGNRVGQLVEGDHKKLVGRAVDEDGDVIDKHGNIVGHAERYEEPEEPEAEKPDLSILNGMTCNKQGNVIGPEGVPIARLVEGNPKELAGKRIDGEGQIWNDQGQVIGRCELIPMELREAKPEGPFAGLEGLVVVKDGWVEDEDGNRVGQVVEGDPKKLVGRAVDEDGDIIDKYGNVKGHAEPWEEEEEEAVDLSSLAGKVVNKAGNVVDEHGTIFGRIVEGDPEKLAGRKVDGQGQIWDDAGNVIGMAELIPGGEQIRKEGPFGGFDRLVVGKEGMVLDSSGQVVGRVIEGDPNLLMGREVDSDGDILDRAGNAIGKAERYELPEKEREISPMSGRKVNKEGEVRDEDGNLIGILTEGNLKNLVGKTVDDNGYVVDNDGNKIGECTLIENLPEEEAEEVLTPEQMEELRKKKEDKELAERMCTILQQTLERVEPVCKQITEHIEVADRTPKEELDEEDLVQKVKPLIEEGGRILQECNGAIRGLDPDGRIAATAKARAASREATPEEYRLADLLKELTTTVVKTIDNAKKRIADMPHAKKKLNPLWYLLTEPLFQIIAAVGLLLAGVLGLVGKLLNGLGLGGLVNGLLGGLGIDKLLGGLGLGSVAEALGLGGGKKKKKS